MPYIKNDYYVTCYHCKMKVYMSTCRRDIPSGYLACKRHYDGVSSNLYTPQVIGDPQSLPASVCNVPSNTYTYRLGQTWSSISIPFNQLNIPFNQLGSATTITIADNTRSDE